MMTVGDGAKSHACIVCERHGRHALQRNSSVGKIVISFDTRPAATTFFSLQKGFSLPTRPTLYYHIVTNVSYIMN